jgi:hypothetical protein
MKKLISLLCTVVMIFAFIFHASAQSLTTGSKGDDYIDLSGSWFFQVDSLDQGVKQQWYNRQLKEKVTLPGSMTTNGKGNDITVSTPWTGSIEDSTWFHNPAYAKYRVPGHVKVPFWLQPDKYYKGAAWYQKSIDVPKAWQGKYIELYIERSHWETTVWVDGKPVGMQNSLATAHIFELSGLKAGRHQITVLIDNRVKSFNVGQNSHSISDHTQSNWNGMVGRLSLNAKPAIYISEIQLYTNIKAKQVTARVSIRNITGKAADVSLNLLALSNNPGTAKLNPKNITRRVTKNTVVEVIYPMGDHPLLWSEFTPDTYQMRVKLSSKQAGVDQSIVTFGMREFLTNGTQFTINGQPTFLRGSLECAEFPKTGYPPTNLESWARIFKICRSYGLNHLRFHSWCPPDAAFEAADNLGFYLQIECSSWANQGATIGDGKALDEYIYNESRSIVKAYGNHPSFCMMAYGNEPAGKNMVKYLSDFVTYWKARDQRRLYTTGAGWPIRNESNFNSTPLPRIQQWGQGLKSIINNQAPRSDYDWANIIKEWKHPTVSHEIGQWCAYPDFKEISQYDGVLKAKNVEIFKDQLEKNGMGALSEDFLQASGKLQVLCYKADIEAALRTPGFGGFQLLGLYDFPGQGTALVGVLNPFWKDKGYVTSKEYSEFCNAVVPLVRLPKMVYLNNENLFAPVEIAQFSTATLKEVEPSWDIKNEKGDILFQGKLNKTSIQPGNGIKLGDINVALADVKEPSRLKISVHVANYQNSWDIFVYPAKLPVIEQQTVISQTLDQKAIETLANGGKVLLTLKKGTLKPNKGGDIAIGFSSIFWNTAWTKSQPPVTLGILCDPKNPALKEFPTQAYSNWQWWDGMTHSNAIMLTEVSATIKPIVRVIDDWVTARPLGLIFECKVGKGKLIVSGIDLLTDQEKRPEARQLLYSLKSYMNTDSFSPDVEVNLEKITSLYDK